MGSVRFCNVVVLVVAARSEEQRNWRIDELHTK
jgi:hypothetical protein